MNKGMIRILVADDDMFIRNQLQTLFTSKSTSVIAVKTAEAALETIKNDGADIALVDVYMDGMTGPELVSLLNETDNNIPVIVMTGDTSIELERYVRALGVFAYFLKPLETKLLAETVKAAIELAVKIKGTVR